jgi:hypothetical protein
MLHYGTGTHYYVTLYGTGTDPAAVLAEGAPCAQHVRRDGGAHRGHRGAAGSVRHNQDLRRDGGVQGGSPANLQLLELIRDGATLR